MWGTIVKYTKERMKDKKTRQKYYAIKKKESKRSNQ